MGNKALKNLSPQQLGNYINAELWKGKSVIEVKAEIIASGVNDEKFKAATYYTPLFNKNQFQEQNIEQKKVTTQATKGFLILLTGVLIQALSWGNPAYGFYFLLAFAPIIYGCKCLFTGFRPRIWE